MSQRLLSKLSAWIHPPVFKEQVIDQTKPSVKQHFKLVAPFWQSIYANDDVYGLIHRKRRDLVLLLVEQLRLPINARALDIGCGAGYIAVGLALQGLSVHAIDPVPEMIAMTRRAAADMKLENVLATTGDIDHLPFAAQSFEVVLAIGVLPWLTSYSAALQQVRRVLRPGGFFIANIDNTLALHRLLDPGMNFLLRPAKQLLRAFCAGTRHRRVQSTTVFPSQFRCLLRAHGLQPGADEMYGFGPISFFGREILSNRTGVALHRKAQVLCEKHVPVVRSLGAQYLVVAQKIDC